MQRRQLRLWLLWAAVPSGLFLVLCYGIAGTWRAPVDVSDGFDSDRLSDLWQTNRFAPGAVVLQSQLVRAGHGAARIALHKGEVFEAGINGNKDSERAELLEAAWLYAKENMAYEQSFSMYLPGDFPIVPTRLVIAQWKQYCGGDGKPCSDDSPVLAIRYSNGILRITQKIHGRQTTLYQQPEDLRGQWLDFRFRVRFSTQQTGRVQAWLNGQPIIDFNGITANPEDSSTGYSHPSRFYFKMGLYRDVMDAPMTIYIDEYRKRQLTEGSF